MGRRLLRPSLPLPSQALNLAVQVKSISRKAEWHENPASSFQPYRGFRSQNSARLDGPHSSVPRPPRMRLTALNGPPPVKQRQPNSRLVAMPPAKRLPTGDDLGCLLQRLGALDQIIGRKLATPAGSLSRLRMFNDQFARRRRPWSPPD